MAHRYTVQSYDEYLHDFIQFITEMINESMHIPMSMMNYVENTIFLLVQPEWFNNATKLQRTKKKYLQP